MKLAIYSVTSLDPSPDAVTMVERVNEFVAKNKWSLDRERVQAALDEMACADEQTRLGLRVSEAGFEMEHDE